MPGPEFFYLRVQTTQSKGSNNVRSVHYAKGNRSHHQAITNAFFFLKSAMPMTGAR